jgi:hypothetical protein
MWEATQRAKQRLPIIDRNNTEKEKFLFSLTIGEIFEIDDERGGRVLCVVRKIDQRSKRVDYKYLKDARTAGEIEKDRLYFSPEKMQKKNACKVTVDRLGRIRRAND